MREGLRLLERSPEAPPAGPTVLLTTAGPLTVAEAPEEVSKRYLGATAGGRSTIEATVHAGGEEATFRPAQISVAHMIAWWRG